MLQIFAKPIPTTFIFHIKQTQARWLRFSENSYKVLHRAGKISDGIIVMADRMHKQKSSLYLSGEYVGADADGNLYKGIRRL